MTWFRAVLAMLLLSLAALPAVAQAQLPPRPNGPIFDGANIIAPADEAALDAKLRAYSQTTGRAIIVATVPSLDGEEIESYAQDLATGWDIGGKETENGLLFLIAPNERRVRIHTARGLQESMTDIMSGRIIRNVITPHFKAGDLSGGIVAGVDAIVQQLDMDPAQARAIEEAAAAAERGRGNKGGFPVSFFIWLGVTFFFFVLPMLGRMRGGRRYHGGGGMGDAVGNVVMWSALNAAMNSGRRSGGDDWGSGFGGGSGGFGGGGGFGGFGGGGGGFNGGGASGSW